MAVAPESRIGHYLDGHLQLVKVLGVGAYGVVYAAVDIYDNTPYAVKALSKVGPTGLPIDDAQKKFQAREISLHARARRHPNIVSLIEILDGPDCVYVVMEYCPEGDLFAAITEKHHYVGDDLLAKQVFLQLVDAVQFCHRIGVYHRDLKPENVLVCDQSQTVKLADFGLATTEQFTTDFGCGSTFYMSPECHKRSGASCYESAPNDVWSLGVILVNLTCGRNPWKRAELRDETYSAYLRDPQFLRSILPLSPELNQILIRIFEPNPRKRITLDELREAIINCPRFTVYPQTSSPVIEETEWTNVIVEEQVLAEPFQPVFEEVSTFVSVEAPPTPISTPQKPPPLNLNGLRTIPNHHYPPTPVSPNLPRPRRPKRVGRQQIPHRRDMPTQRRYHRDMSMSQSSSISSDRSFSRRFGAELTPEDSPCPPTPTSMHDGSKSPRVPAEALGFLCNPVIDNLEQPFTVPPSRGVPVY
jgi:serine/threonine protein kinase